jgi:PAS domain S-box-containing protein
VPNESPLAHSPSIPPRATVLKDLKDFVAFEPSHAVLLTEIQPHVEPAFDDIVEAFYAAIARTPVTAAALTGGDAQVARLKATLRDWLGGVFGGVYDEAYVERRARIGRAHVRIDLPHRYMFGAMNLIRQALHVQLERSTFDRDRLYAAHSAIDAICDFELAIITESYVEVRAKDLYRGVVDSVNEMMIATGPEGTVEFANRYALSKLGLSAREIRGRDFVALAAMEEERSRLKRVMDRQDGSRITVRMPARAGTAVVRWTFASLTHMDGIAMLLAVGVDETERIDLERRTARTEALAAMATLTAGLAHEIRNPLNAAQLQLELLSRAASRLGDAEHGGRIGERVTIVKSELSRLATMLDDFLKLARPTHIEKEPFELLALVDEVVQLEGPLAHVVGVQMGVVPGAARYDLVGDRDRVKQVLVNLLNNSIEAMQRVGGGLVTIELEHVHGEVHVRVVDTGPGIPADTAKHIFEPFFTTKEAGTGLGLAIVKKIVEVHGGSVAIEASENGTVAAFTLPLGPAEK